MAPLAFAAHLAVCKRMALEKAIQSGPHGRRFRSRLQSQASPLSAKAQGIRYRRMGATAHLWVSTVTSAMCAPCLDCVTIDTYNLLCLLAMNAWNVVLFNPCN